MTTNPLKHLQMHSLESGPNYMNYGCHEVSGPGTVKEITCGAKNRQGANPLYRPF